MTADFAGLFRKGDLSRDRGDWIGAREAYHHALGMDAGHGGLWVQYGHALKESGDPAAAEHAYRRALALDENPADTWLQLGHALKRQGRLAEAEHAYAQTARYGVVEHAIEELRAIGWSERDLAALQSPAPFSAIPEAAPTILDVSDLIAFARDNLRPSGIQRVQAEIVRAAIAGDMEAGYAHYRAERETWVRLEPRDLLAVVDALTGGRIEHGEAVDLKAAMETLDRQAQGEPDLALLPGLTLISLGGCWAIRDHPARIADAVARHAIRYVPFIYDLVPILRPQFCTRGTVEEFETWLRAVAPHVAGWLTCSDSTARDLHHVLGAQRGNAWIRTVPLDTGFVAEVSEDEVAEAVLRLHLAGRPYVLFVSTIEPRKNHTNLLHAWRELAARHGDRTPRLVLVGKVGWLAEKASAMLEGMRDDVVHLATIGDRDLAALYRGAMCTVYPSFYEGWGLPVTESLSFGRVPLVSAVASLPEATQGLGITFDPNEPREIAEALGALIEDPEKLAGLERRIARDFRPRSWRQIAQDVIG